MRRAGIRVALPPPQLLPERGGGRIAGTRPRSQRPCSVRAAHRRPARPGLGPGRALAVLVGVASLRLVQGLLRLRGVASGSGAVTMSSRSHRRARMRSEHESARPGRGRCGPTPGAFIESWRLESWAAAALRIPSTTAAMRAAVVKGGVCNSRGLAPLRNGIKCRNTGPLSTNEFTLV